MAMMNFNEISKVSTADKPSELVARYLLHEQAGGTLYEFLAQFDFASREEIALAVRDLAYTIVGDKYITDKRTQENNVFARCIFRRFNSICTNPDKFDKYPISVSGELWHGGNSRKKIQQATQELFDEWQPTCDEWEQAKARIQSLYGLTDKDTDKLQFFIEQCKAGAEFPNSLRRMLYIWGSTKMTGKTTTATMIVSILNGERDYKNIAKYSTSLAYEMQIKSFAVPKISECNACLMDECFYADMGKTYADFKRFMTSSGGRSRLPFGQEFAWEGYPNYVATSNDPLRKFIKDWDDRRYLSIEFKIQPTERLEFDAIYELWRVFIVGSTRELSWYDWAERIAQTSNEVGERTERALEFEIEMQRNEFLDFIISKQVASDSATCKDNRVSLKFFVDYFAAGGHAAEVSKRRDEIEQAVLKVFGPRYSTQTYWLLSDLRKRAHELKYNTNGDEDASADDEDVNDLPF